MIRHGHECIRPPLTVHWHAEQHKSDDEARKVVRRDVIPQVPGQGLEDQAEGGHALLGPSSTKVRPR